MRVYLFVGSSGRLGVRMIRKRQSRDKYYARRIDYLIAKPSEALKAKDIRSDPEVCRRLLALAGERQNKNPKQAQRLATIGSRLANAGGDSCL